MMLVFAISVLALTGCGTATTSSPELNTFAQCITAAGAKMYGADTCSHCQNQKKLFGSSFQYITYVDCNKSSTQCSVAGIEKIPTWEFADSSKEVGEQTFEALSAKTNCVLGSGS